MQGQRTDIDLYNPVGPRMKPGDYGKDTDGIWHCCAPRDTGDWFTNFHGCLGDGSGVKGHKVVEHEDGSITVSPSILINRYDGSWHGFLECGVWREC